VSKASGPQAPRKSKNYIKKCRGIYMSENKCFEKYKENATMNDIEKIDNKLGSMKKGKIEEVWTQVEAMYNMMKDPKAAWTSKVIIIGALIYLISPIDAVPDVIPIAGLADDAGIILAAVKQLGKDLTKYMLEISKLETSSNKGVRPL
jgi:uncharacterized membrane protein YkvA (DUF1232 family)